MKKNWLLIVGIALLLVAAVLIVNSASNQPQVTAVQNATQPAAQTPAPHHEHSTGATAKALPAHFEVPPSKSLLGPTLNPDSFAGPVRDAYRAVFGFRRRCWR